MKHKQSSLHAETVAMREAIRAEVGAQLDAWDAGAEKLSELRFDTPGVGALAPGFELPDQAGRATALSQLLSRGPVVLVFYRGAWCPYCNLQLRAFQSCVDEITDLGAALVAISPQTPDTSSDFASEQGFVFTVLSDAGNQVARRYGLVYELAPEAVTGMREGGLDLYAYNGDETWTLPASATFVIDGNGRILFESVAADYRWRVGPEEVLAALSESKPSA
jgi:peroxiredoxin